MQAIGQEGYEYVRFNSVSFLVVHRTQCQISFEVLECLLHLRQLCVILPELNRIFLFKIGSQQITSLATAHLPQLGFAQTPRECLLVDFLILPRHAYGD
ncbi:hypothetical protein SDC9_100541 [bioreactor metagenome]|uniref:Uncharacterized protein n=1 Tax=bioreactor metagenome TaxID=1076179 RepID=A0A645AKM2_9ZZZZ